VATRPAKRSWRTLDHRVQVARARRFLATHVGDEVQLAAVARAAGASMFHLARLYRAITGETVGRALTRMRIERAAARLVETPRRPVSAIALEVGFATPSALTKAFRAALGRTPTAYRAATAAERRAALRRIAVEAPAPVAFALSEPRIVHRGELRVVHVREHGGYADIAAPLAWAMLELRIAGTPLAAGPRIAASYDDPDSVAPELLRYDAGVIVAPGVAAPPGTRAATWRGGAFAVFEYRGDYWFIADAFRRIFARWPDYRLRKRDAPCLELYRARFDEPPAAHAITELWIPIEGGPHRHD
jgi:AraC family transcriptional regulator